MEELQKKKRKGAGRVAFLAHLEGIKKMIEAGHPLVSVFEEYENKLSIKPGQFGKYVRKYIRSKSTNENHGEKTNAPTQPTEKRRERATGFMLNTDTSDKRKKTIV